MSALDAQREAGKRIYGGGLLLSDEARGTMSAQARRSQRAPPSAPHERAAAERAAERAAAHRLSDRKTIVESLG
ncbi:MAG: hypothetical protein ACLSVD_02905 [Eggerthellaceae bacterium]